MLMAEIKSTLKKPGGSPGWEGYGGFFPIFQEKLQYFSSWKLFSCQFTSLAKEQIKMTNIANPKAKQKGKINPTTNYTDDFIFFSQLKARKKWDLKSSSITSTKVLHSKYFLPHFWRPGGGFFII